MNKKEIILHVAGGLAFLLVPQLFFPRPPEASLFDFSGPTLRDFTANVLLLLFFYLNYYVLIPRLYFERRLLPYFSAVLLGFAIIILLPSVVTGGPGFGSRPAENGQGQRFGPGSMEGQSSYLQTVSHLIFLFVAVVLFSILLRVRQRYFQTETARQQAELLSLKAQINPHFLFNTLNSIYALALTNPTKTADAIVQLSALMRYIMQDTKSDSVPLQKELDYIRAYIGLQQSRLGDTVLITYSTEGGAGSLQIAPLLLMSFIENAFKHGVNPDEESEIRIAILIAGQQLALAVFNKKVNSINGDEYSGIGLENTKERLNLRYKNRHTLRIEDSPTTYTTHLILQV